MRANVRIFVALAATLWMTTAVAGEGVAPSDGTLRKFEKSVQTAQKENSQSDTRRNSTYDDQEEPGFWESLFAENFGAIMEVATTVIVDGGRSSLNRVESESEFGLQRDGGEILLPFLRYDYAAQHVSSNISARIHQFEGGYGPVALFLEDYTFSERQPADTLKVKRQLLLYRMSINRLELDIGAGQTVIEGWQRTEIGVVSLRGQIQITQNVVLEFSPTWGNGMDDYEIAIHVGRQYGSLKIGYRSLQSPDVSLNGPFAGLALYF